MTFTIQIKIDTHNLSIKDECIEALAELLDTKGVYFGVGYDPNEIDEDSIAKA